MRFYLIVFLLCNLVAAQRINLPAAIIAGNVDVVDQILFSGYNYSIFSCLTDMIKIAIQNHHWDILESIYKYKKLQDELFDSCANGNLAKFDDLILNHSASPGDGGNMCLGIESGRSEHAWIKISVRSPLIYLNWLNLTY